MRIPVFHFTSMELRKLFRDRIGAEALAVCVLTWVWSVLMFGCSSGSSAGKIAGTRQGKGNSALDPKQQFVQRAIQLWRPRLGKVVLVDEKAGFVLVDIGTAPAPVAGTELRAYSQETEAGLTTVRDAKAEVVELTVSSFQRRPYLIADIRAGRPKAGDDVVRLDPPPKKLEQDQREKMVGKERAPSGGPTDSQGVGAPSGGNLDTDSGVIPGILPPASSIKDR